MTKRIAKDNGGKVRQADLARQHVLPASYRRFFPSMYALCAEAGVTYAGPPKWTDAELLRAFRELAERLGRTPSNRDLGPANGTAGSTAYRRHLGGLEEVCRRLGLPSNSPRPITFGDEIDILNRFGQVGSKDAVVRAIHRDTLAVGRILAKYGVPLWQGAGHESERREAREWAAEIAQRLAS